MKTFGRWFFILLCFGVAGVMRGQVYNAQNDQVQKDIQSHLADMRQAKMNFDASQADLSAQKKQLADSSLSFDQHEAIRGRMDKDNTDIQTYTSQILGDRDFLQGEWSDLTQPERDYVTQVEQSLS